MCSPYIHTSQTLNRMNQAEQCAFKRPLPWSLYLRATKKKLSRFLTCKEIRHDYQGCQNTLILSRHKFYKTIKKQLNHRKNIYKYKEVFDLKLILRENIKEIRRANGHQRWRLIWNRTWWRPKMALTSIKLNLLCKLREHWNSTLKVWFTLFLVFTWYTKWKDNY